MPGVACTPYLVDPSLSKRACVTALLASAAAARLPLGLQPIFGTLHQIGVLSSV
jgi:hypothetical protein